MKLVAQRPCSFGGKRFVIGEEIPTDLVVNPAALAKMGVISIVNDAPAVATAIDPGDPAGDCPGIAVVLHTEKGDFHLNLTQEGLQSVVDVLTSRGDDAKAIVEQMTDEHALILLDATDSRKNIKEAAKARAMALSSEEAPEETPDEEALEKSAGEL